MSDDLTEEVTYKNILDNIHDGVYFVDRNRKITYWNKGAERITGYKKSEVVGSHCGDNILEHVNKDGLSLCENLCPLARGMREDNTQEADVFLSHKEGHRVAVSLSTTPIHNDEEEVAGAVEIFREVSHDAAMVDRIEKLKEEALRDPLTGLGNRRYIRDIVQSRLNQLERSGWSFGILFIDIDHFKKVNDKYGHEVGDNILEMVSKTLINSSRSFDLVGRWGGEEFLIVISGVEIEELEEIAGRLRVLVETSGLSTEENYINVTVSIGGTTAKNSDNLKTLIKRADDLMYKCKSAGRNCVLVKNEVENTTEPK